MVAIQYTSHQHHSDRVKKIRGHPNFVRVRALGWRIEVWSWRIKGSTPVLREEEVS